MIDGDTGSRYPDVGLSAVCDISKVSWLFACNDHQSLETALMDRLEVVVVRAPDAGLLPMIAESVVSDMASSLGIERAVLPDVDPMMVRRMEDVYSKDQSLRRAAAHLRRDVSRMASSGFRTRLAAASSE
jgi:ATP-dependent Lon protease